MSSTEPRPAWRGWQGIVDAETELEPFTAKRFLTVKAFIGFAGLGLVCLVGIAMVVSEGWSLKGVFMALLMLAIVLFFVAVFAGAHAISNGKVYFAAGPPLTFLPNHRYLGFFSLAALLAMVVGVVGVLTHVVPGVEPITGWGARGGLGLSLAAAGFGAVGAVMCAVMALRAAIELSNAGIRWVSGFRTTEVGWLEMETIERGQRDLRLVAHGATVRASLYTFGSAPDVIVQTIQYYKDHPKQRSLLSDPWQSLVAAAKEETNSA